ncbi:hypothetical protein BH11GEM2_BH11GEM2_26980 [soil metagenome]|jgi:hypothetical protein
MPLRTFGSIATLAALSLVFTSACARNPEPDTEPEMTETPARVAPPAGAVKPGDCPEAVRRAVAKPDLEVDRLATPRANVASAVTGKSMPTAVKRAKYNEVRVTVLVDTLGKPDMKTFTVLKTTHPWLASSFKTAVARWTFEPAQLAGCKVPRVWLGAITSGKPPAT